MSERNSPDLPALDLKTMTSPCEFLTAAERADLGFAAGDRIEGETTGTGPRTTICVFRVTEPWNRSGDYVDSVSVMFLPTTLEVARIALDTTEDKGIFSAGRMARYAARPDGVLQREGTRLGEATCERLFALDGTRSVQVGMTVENRQQAEPTCEAADRLAPVVAARRP